MKKSELWTTRITYVILFALLVGIYELVKWGISSFIGASWASPIILGIVFILGLIYVDLHADDTDISEDILEQPYNYIIIDTQNKTTKINGQVIVERDATVTKNDILELEKYWEIVNILPAYILEPDPDDADVNRIKELIEK